MHFLRSRIGEGDRSRLTVDVVEADDDRSVQSLV